MPTPFDLPVAELQARPEPVPSIGDLSPHAQALLFIAMAEHIAGKDEALGCATARAMLRAALRLDPDARLDLDA